MKTSKQQEIENFVNNLEQSYLSNHQMMTLAVNPESVMGGDLSDSKNKKCTNSMHGCGDSVNTQRCKNTSVACSNSTNENICNNKPSK